MFILNLVRFSGLYNCKVVQVFEIPRLFYFPFPSSITGRTCVVIPNGELDKFDPLQVPFLVDLLKRVISESEVTEEGEKRKKVQ